MNIIGNPLLYTVLLHFEYCDVHLRICLCACVSARISMKPHIQRSPNLLCMLLLHIAIARSLSGSLMQTSYVFPVLWMTSCSCYKHNSQKHAHIQAHSPRGTTGLRRSVMSTISLLILRVHDITRHNI